MEAPAGNQSTPSQGTKPQTPIYDPIWEHRHLVVCWSLKTATFRGELPEMEESTKRLLVKEAQMFRDLDRRNRLNW